jgi:hypothetical protein
MPIDEGLRTNKPLKAATADAGSGNTYKYPVLATVKNNIDETRSGRLQVYLADNSGKDPDDSKNWVPVSFLSPFYGKTTGDSASNTLGKFKTNPVSYGMWFSPPDVGSTVIVIFVDGDINKGFYVGGVPDPNALQMVPAIGAREDVVPNQGEADSFGGAVRVPVTNINSNNKGIADSAEYLTAAKPIHSYSAAIMFRQGILRDPMRGPISTSAQREALSRVGWGVSTPGRPIYEGGFDDQSIVDNLDQKNNKALRVISRRGGHTFVMDDGDIIGRDQLIRIRTALGHQILMSDDGQTLMLLHSNGQTYVELGKEGTVDVYATNSVNIRTQGDLNLHADNNINMNAAKTFNIKADSIQIDTDKDFLQKIGADHKTSIAGLMTVKAGGAMSLSAAGDASLASSTVAFVNGSKINLNTGQTATIPQDVKQLVITAHTDTLFDKQKGFLAAPGKLKSIVSRAPAHYPWVDAGLGVDVSVDLNSDSQLPSPPKPEVAKTNQAVASSNSTSVTPAQIAKQPSTKAVSESIDKPTTAALLSQMENTTRSGPAANAAVKGSTIVTQNNNKTAAIGLYGLNPQQLESAGFIKPGSAKLVEAQIQAGKTVEEAFPTNIWTGKNGIQNVTQFRENKTVQADAAVDLMQQSQTALTKANIISGTEAPPQIAGLVVAGAQSGVDKTIQVVKDLGSATFNLGKSVIDAKLSSKVSEVIDRIAGGNQAGGIGQSVANNLGSIAQAFAAGQAIDPQQALRGISGAAFNAIVARMPRLKAGIPQNLGLALKQSIEKEILNADKAGQFEGGLLGTLSNVGNDVLQAVPGAIGRTLNKEIYKALPGAGGALAAKVSGTLADATQDILTKVVKDPGNIIGALGSIDTYKSGLNAAGEGLSSAANQLAKNVTASASSSLASGLRNVVGGPKIATFVTDKLGGAVDSIIPGSGKISSLVKDFTASAFDGVKGQFKGIVDPLDKLASFGLNPGAAAQLQAALAAVGSAASNSIKLPTAAVNTLEIGAINQSFDSILDDPGIPKPASFGIVDDTVKSKFEELDNQRIEKLKKLQQYKEFLDKQKAANLAYKQAVSTLPAGSPDIAKKRQEFIDITTNAEFLRLAAEINNT